MHVSAAADVPTSYFSRRLTQHDLALTAPLLSLQPVVQTINHYPSSVPRLQRPKTEDKDYAVSAHPLGIQTKLLEGEEGLTPVAPVRLRAMRWSGDAWFLLRSGAAAASSPDLLIPVYGGSQAGAVVRYRLASLSPRREEGYLRVVTSLERQRDVDIAAGFSIRPVTGLPITAHAELRARPQSNGIAVRPAAFLSTGVDEAPVISGVTMRGYAQAGYVGGTASTGFADGSVIAERQVGGEAKARVALGIGAWGGIQKDRARFDAGPSATVTFSLGAGTARLSADYRLRIAGNAEPRRGAALTLSASF